MSGIPRFDTTQLGIPRSVRGYNPDEFIYVDLDSSLDASKFRVLLEDLSGRYISLGSPLSRVFLPNTVFGENAMLVVVGTNKSGEQVRFLSTLKRGEKYVLRGSKGGDYRIQRSIPTSC